jgi:hypothetical protein
VEEEVIIILTFSFLKRQTPTRASMFTLVYLYSPLSFHCPLLSVKIAMNAPTIKKSAAQLQEPMNCCSRISDKMRQRANDILRVRDSRSDGEKKGQSEPDLYRIEKYSRLSATFM